MTRERTDEQLVLTFFTMTKLTIELFSLQRFQSSCDVCRYRRQAKPMSLAFTVDLLAEMIE